MIAIMSRLYIMQIKTERNTDSVFKVPDVLYIHT